MKVADCSIVSFWDRVYVVDPNDPKSCWEYSGAVYSSGKHYYGSFCGEAAHQVAAAIYTGQKVGTIKRSCNNKLCVRREHYLSVGFPRQTARYHPVTGEQLPSYHGEGSPVYKKIIELKAVGQTLDFRALMRQFDLPKWKLNVISKAVTLDVILLDRANYIKNRLPIPVLPTGTNILTEAVLTESS